MDNLKKNDIFEVQIESFSADGGGVCRVDGRAVFVPRALPGERWRIRILKANKTAVWARGEELLQPSSDRTEPLCPVFGKCGGCAVMHMQYETELRFKLERVNNALQRIGGLELRADSILGAAEELGYRNKSIYNFAPGPVCGFYRERSHQILPSPRCYLQPECFDRAAEALRQWMESAHIPAYDEESGRGLIRHLYLRKAGDSVLACIIAAGDVPAEAVNALRSAAPEISGVMQCINDRPGNGIMTDRLKLLWGSEYLQAELCGTKLRLSPLTFFQVNTVQAERLYALVRQYAQPTGKTVLDLYCGAGSIGLAAAADAKQLFGNDIIPSAVDNARYNAMQNGVTNAEYLCGDAGCAAGEFARRGIRPEVIIVDPPRKGIDSSVIEAICQMAPERLVYVSCDPATLARDLRLLNARGYRPDQCTAVDLFPKTKHVETVVLMSRNQE